jgi:hypothetical protein
LQDDALPADKLERFDQVVEDAELVELGFLVGRSDGAVPPVGVPLDCGSDEGSGECAGLGELDAGRDFGEEPEQRLDRLLALDRRRGVAVGGCEGMFEQVALFCIAAGQFEPGLAAGGVDAGEWRSAALVRIP